MIEKQDQKKKLLLDFLTGENNSFKKTMKEIYNLKNDVRVCDLNNVFVTNKEFIELKRIAKLKEDGEDITFEIGYRYFRGNKLLLEKGVFVPQYDTEQIVDLVLNLDIKKGRLIEVGSGTGAISISLKNETKFDITSIDINPKAIKISKTNNKLNNKDKITFIYKDFNKFKPKEKFDILISNPPYIKIGDEEVEEWVKINQPKEALYAGEDGLDFYRSIFSNVKLILNKNTYIILEIGYSQFKEVKNLAEKISTNIKVIKDYSGFDRFMVIKYEQ